MKNIFNIILILILILILHGCSKEPSSHSLTNKSPKTFLWLFPDSTIGQGPSRQHIHWWGDDPDGIVKGYLFASDSVKIFIDSLGVMHPSSISWRWRTGNDTIIAFPLERKEQTFFVAVRAVDNTFPYDITDFSRVQYSSNQLFWDKNENGILDASDILLTFPSNSIDPGLATLDMPTLNQPPSFDTTFSVQQPETTYTAATFAWIGTDPDGDNTITRYRIALNDPTDPLRWTTLPAKSITTQDDQFGSISLVTLFVPRSRSDTATIEVSADVYSGKFSQRQKIGSVSGLRLDAPNIFYLQAIDIASDTSHPIVRIPSVGKNWFVRKPQNRILAIVDDNSTDSAIARNIYWSALSQVILSTGLPASVDDLNIGRGISNIDKQNNANGEKNTVFGVLVPPFIDPAFIYTLYLFDCVFWYTDIYPTSPVAQLSLFPYINTEFSGHKGKVIFSTSFEKKPDPRGLIKEFAPIDSISTIDLVFTDPYTGGRLLPVGGDTQIPSGYELLPDYSDQSYPKLKFAQKEALYSIYLRQIYRRPDARYIYHIQDDQRDTIFYTNTATSNELKAICELGNSAIVCGAKGTILYTANGGDDWSGSQSGTNSTLNSVDFINVTNGLIVGDAGTILQTNNGGISWNDRSLPTAQNLRCVDFISTTTGIAVGTSGILLRTVDGGVHWESKTSTTKKNLNSVNFYDENNGIAVGDSAIIKTTDGGSTWRSILAGNFPRRSYVSVKYLNESTIYAVASYRNLYSWLVRSTDAGETWSVQVIPSFPFYREILRSIYFLNTTDGWICGNKKDGADGREVVYRTNDGGVSWTQYLSNETQDLNAIAFTDINRGWSVGTGGIIFHTENGAQNWITQPKGNINVAVIDGVKSFVFIGLPLYVLNGDGDNLYKFFKHVLKDEFGL